MALTRNFLKGMGLTEEQVGAIIDAHTETTDALKQERDQYKADAEKLTTVQKELDTLKAGKDWHKEYNELQKSFDAYKADVASKEELAAKQTAFRKLLTELGIPEKFHDRIIKMTDFTAIEMEGEGLKDEDAQKAAIDAEWGDYKAAPKDNGAPVDTPPANNPPAFEALSLAGKMRFANEHPNDPAVSAWLKK